MVDASEQEGIIIGLFAGIAAVILLWAVAWGIKKWWDYSSAPSILTWGQRYIGFIGLAPFLFCLVFLLVDALLRKTVTWPIAAGAFSIGWVLNTAMRIINIVFREYLWNKVLPATFSAPRLKYIASPSWAQMCQVPFMSPLGGANLQHPSFNSVFDLYTSLMCYMVIMLVYGMFRTGQQSVVSIFVGTMSTIALAVTGIRAWTSCSSWSSIISGMALGLFYAGVHAVLAGYYPIMMPFSGLGSLGLDGSSTSVANVFGTTNVESAANQKCSSRVDGVTGAGDYVCDVYDDKGNLLRTINK